MSFPFDFLVPFMVFGWYFSFPFDALLSGFPVEMDSLDRWDILLSFSFVRLGAVISFTLHMFLAPTGMENLRWICLHVSKPLALIPICRQTVTVAAVVVAAAALVVEIKMNSSSAANLVHSCPSAVDAAPSVRS